MPEDNRFAGLSEAVEDDSDDEPDSEPNSETGPAADDSSDQSNSTPETESESAASDGVSDTETDTDTGVDDTASDETADTATDAGVDADDPTAFPFDATEKKTVYVRPETLDQLEDVRALVDAQLRTDHDVRDLTGREFYDAAFRLAASDTDGLIEQLLEAREESDD